MKRLLLAMLAGLTACSSNNTNIQQRALNRPGELAIACMSTDRDLPLPLSACQAPDEDGDGVPDDAAEPAGTARTHAFVAQTSTDEVASIQVDGDTDARVIDANPAIPGFTFFEVDGGPAVVFTPTGAAGVGCTYVASREEGTVQVLPTAAFRGRVPGDAQVARVVLPGAGRPTAMEPIGDESRLVLTLPEQGALVTVDVSVTPDPSSGDADATADAIAAVCGTPPAVGAPIALSEAVPEAVDLTVLAEADQPREQIRVCPGSLEDPPRVPPRTPRFLGDTPRPVDLAHDAVDARLYVADAHLPIVHVLDVSDPAAPVELAPLSVGVPTLALALTPYVPAEGTEPGLAVTERYLYAVDATDGSVLVVDVSDPASARYGAVLTVDGRGTRPGDRVDLPFAVRSLEVVTPGYPVELPRGATLPVPDGSVGDIDFGVACTPTDLTVSTRQDRLGPRFLRGVFLAAAGTDGLMWMVDIHDLDAGCRGIDATCYPGLDSSGFGISRQDRVMHLRRHRRRLADFLEDAIEIADAPTWQSDLGATVDVSPSGQAGSNLPTLRATACPLGQAPIFGDPVGVLCAQTDPYAATTETWFATWEGTVPRTAGTGGRLTVDGETATLSATLPVCDVGVLGAEDTPSEGALAGYGGDQVRITNDPVDRDLDDSIDCAALFGDEEDDREGPLLPIRRAAQGEDGSATLVLRPPDGQDEGFLAAVDACFGDRLTFQIQVRDAFRVFSSREGMLRRTRVGAEGRCEVDPSLDPRRRSRAFLGEPFANLQVAFTLDGDPGLVETTRPTLTFTLAELPVFFLQDLSDFSGNTNLPSLPAALRFNPVDERLYVVEQASRGLALFTFVSTAGFSLAQSSEGAGRVFR
jgi:hypothetical protein